MSELKAKVLAAAAFDSLKDYSYDSENDIIYHYHIRMLPLLTALAEVVESSQELRIYCLGSDASTQNMIVKFDAKLEALRLLCEGEK